VQPVAGGRQPTNRGKIMGRSSFVHVGGSMLSAFSFREFRGINRRAAGACVHLFMCTRVYAHVCGCLRDLAAPGVQRDPPKRRRPNIRHPRDLCTPLRHSPSLLRGSKLTRWGGGGRGNHAVGTKAGVVVGCCCF